MVRLPSKILFGLPLAFVLSLAGLIKLGEFSGLVMIFAPLLLFSIVGILIITPVAGYYLATNPSLRSFNQWAGFSLCVVCILIIFSGVLLGLGGI